MIPFTVEDFKSAKPYEYLCGIEDKFQQRMEIERFRAFAKVYRFSGLFARMWKDYLQSKGVAKSLYSAENSTSITGFDTQLRTGDYEVTDDGVTLFRPDTGPITVCPHPIIPVKRIVNLDTGEYKIMLAYRRGDAWKTAIIDKAILASAQKIVALATWDIAVDSENAKLMVTYLSKMENLNYTQIEESRAVSRLGWIRGYGFAPYVDGLMFDGLEQYRHAFAAIHTAGSEAEWMSLARQVRSGESQAARIMLASSFASALVGPLNALPFMVHCWSNCAGIGKTVALMTAASVWGSPQIGDYVRTFNSTSVGLEMLAGFCGSLPLCIDELCLKDGRRDQFDSMIYSYCEGVGRTRGNRNGGIQKTLSWQNCAISTGEEPLTSGNSRSGAINRVLDINAGETKMFQDPREAVRIISKHFGHAGKKFVQSIDEHALETLKKRQQDYAASMEGRATDKQILSASIILTADWWATKILFKDRRALTVEEILPNLQTPASADVNRRCYDWLMDTVAANPGKFEQQEDGSYSGECWGVTEWENGKIYLIKSIFDRLLKEEGYSTAGFLQWAGREGFLKRDNGHNTLLKRLDRGRVLRCVCLTMDTNLPDDPENL